MKKIVINGCHGGFSISAKGFDLINKKREKRNLALINSYYDDVARDDPCLIEAFEEIGQEVCTRRSKFEIVEIPDDVEWEICEYDGLEWVAEKHRKWYGKED